MTYTSGIRKIFTLDTYRDIVELFAKAEKSGYKLVCHNGIVYAFVGPEEWVATSLTISDFEV